MRQIIFLIPLFFIPSLLFSATNDPAAQKYFQDGLVLKDQNKLADSEQQFKKALEIDPSNPDYHFELANIYAMEHDVYFSSKESLKSQSMLDAASRELEQAVMVKPDFVMALYNLGVVYKRTKKFERAREQFRKVLELQPNHVNAQIQIGLVYEEQGFFEDAEDAYRKAREIEPTSPDIPVLMGNLKQHSLAFKQRTAAESDAANQGRMMQSPFDYAKTNLNQSDQQNQGSINQALPYLGQWLASEFLKGRSSDQE